MREEDTTTRLGEIILGAIREEVTTQVREEMDRVRGIREEVPEDRKEMLTSREAAEYLGVTVNYLHKLSATGALPYTKPRGKLKYFSRKDLDERLRANKKN